MFRPLPWDACIETRRGSRTPNHPTSGDSVQLARVLQAEVGRWFVVTCRGLLCDKSSRSAIRVAPRRPLRKMDSPDGADRPARVYVAAIHNKAARSRFFGARCCHCVCVCVNLLAPHLFSTEGERWCKSSVLMSPLAISPTTKAILFKAPDATARTSAGSG